MKNTCWLAVDGPIASFLFEQLLLYCMEAGKWFHLIRTQPQEEDFFKLDLVTWPREI